MDWTVVERVYAMLFLRAGVSELRDCADERGLDKVCLWRRTSVAQRSASPPLDEAGDPPLPGRCAEARLRRAETNELCGAAADGGRLPAGVPQTGAQASSGPPPSATSVPPSWHPMQTQFTVAVRTNAVRRNLG